MELKLTFNLYLSYSKTQAGLKPFGPEKVKAKEVNRILN